LTVHFANGESLQSIVDEREKVKAEFKQAVEEGKTAVEGTYSH